VIATTSLTNSDLAEGLVEGVGEVFDESIDIQQTECMHDGAEKCRLELRFG
jgi:predicted hydrocarbon binding protein